MVLHGSHPRHARREFAEVRKGYRVQAVERVMKPWPVVHFGNHLLREKIRKKQSEGEDPSGEPNSL